MTRPGGVEAAPVLHATTIALRRDGRWRGVLVRGPSGAGKSDLALRALGSGWRLVADDRTVVWVSGGALFARAPSTLRGLIEARGLGVLAAPPLLAPARLAMVVDALPSGETGERLPDVQSVRILQITLRCLPLHLLDASAVAKIERALACAPL